jgi:hypothetical protein
MQSYGTPQATPVLYHRWFEIAPNTLDLYTLDRSCNAVYSSSCYNKISVGRLDASNIPTPLLYLKEHSPTHRSRTCWHRCSLNSNTAATTWLIRSAGSRMPRWSRGITNHHLGYRREMPKSGYFTVIKIYFNVGYLECLSQELICKVQLDQFRCTSKLVLQLLSEVSPVHNSVLVF